MPHPPVRFICSNFPQNLTRPFLFPSPWYVRKKEPTSGVFQLEMILHVETRVVVRSSSLLPPYPLQTLNYLKNPSVGMVWLY